MVMERFEGDVIFEFSYLLFFNKVFDYMYSFGISIDFFGNTNVV